MRYGDVLRHSWRLVRSNRALVWLAALRVLGSSGLALLVGVAMMPLMAAILLPSLADAGEALGVDPTAGALTLIEQYWPTYLALLAVSTIVALGLAAFDVGAYGGLVAESDAADRSAGASVGRGLRKGFGRWTTSAALIGLSWIPSLAIALFYAGMTFVSFKDGVGADAIGRLTIFSSIASPVVSLLSLAAIPLAVLVEISLRSALLADRRAGDSLRDSWHLVRGHLNEVGLIYLALFAILYAAAFAVGLVFAVIAGVGVVAGVIAYEFGGVPALIVVAGAVISVLALAQVAYAAVLTAFQVTTWTVLWREIAGYSQRFTAAAAPVHEGQQ